MEKCRPGNGLPQKIWQTAWSIRWLTGSTEIDEVESLSRILIRLEDKLDILFEQEEISPPSLATAGLTFVSKTSFILMTTSLELDI